MNASAPLRIAFIGGGNMVRGLLGGLLAHGVDPEHVTVAAPSEATRAALARDFGVQVTPDNATAVESANVVVLAVKPQVMAEVARALAPALQLARPLVLSVAAGIRLRELQQWLGEGIAVVRAMPNRPALIGAGATGLFTDARTGDAQRALAGQLMASTGLALWVGEEAQLDAVTALSGSGPAYFFRLAELMAEAGVQLGLSPETARQLAAQTLAGAGQMVAAAPAPDLAAMRAAVTSRGGTTAAALARFDELDFGATVAAAMRAAAGRSRELAEEFGHKGN